MSDMLTGIFRGSSRADWRSTTGERQVVVTTAGDLAGKKLHVASIIGKTVKDGDVVKFKVDRSNSREGLPTAILVERDRQ